MNHFLAALCVLFFSITVPATRAATQVLDSSTVTLLRLLGAGLICAFSVLFLDRWAPPRKILVRLFSVSMGSVLGFSSFLALAMKRIPASHGAIALAAMPSLTAVYASLRDRSNPGNRFWAYCALGTLLSLSYFFIEATVVLNIGDAYLVAAVLASVYGYVEGGRLSREHGGRRVMSWAILLAMPPVLAVAFALLDRKIFNDTLSHPKVLAAVIYLASVSQSLGMFLWYRVLSKGKMAKIAMIQLLQPFFTLAASMILLGETLSHLTWATAALVALCVFGANQAKLEANKV